METKSARQDADRARRTAVRFTVAALVLACGFGWAFATWMSRTNTNSATTTVVVAAAALPPFTRLVANDLSVVSWPLAAVPEGSFSSTTDILATPHVNLRPLLAGELVLASRIAPATSGAGAAQIVEPSKRAFVVEVNASLAVSELLYPGVTVDVVATFPDRGISEATTKVVLQNVKVLAIGPQFDPTDRSAGEDNKDDQKSNAEVARRRVVTVQVSPEDVEYLAFAARSGSIDLALRNATDETAVATSGVTRTMVLSPSAMETTEESDSEVGKHPAATKAPAKVVRTKRKAKVSEPAIYRVGQ